MNYYIKWRDEVNGPFDEQTLAEQYRAKQLTRFHQVSLDQANWIPLTSLRSVTDPSFRPCESTSAVAPKASRHPTAKISPSDFSPNVSGTEKARTSLRVGARDTAVALTGNTTVTSTPQLFVTPGILCDPKEGLAFGWLVFFSVFTWLGLIGAAISTVVAFGMASLMLAAAVIALVSLSVLFGELFAAAYIKTNALRISGTQIPELYRILSSFAQQLGYPLPAVYVMQESAWNALACKLAGRRVVVLFSGAVDALLSKGSTVQLAWLAGHELGHHFVSR